MEFWKRLEVLVSLAVQDLGVTLALAGSQKPEASGCTSACYNRPSRDEKACRDARCDEFSVKNQGHSQRRGVDPGFLY